MELESNRKYTDEEEAWALGSFAIFSLHLNNRISGLANISQTEIYWICYTYPIVGMGPIVHRHAISGGLPHAPLLAPCRTWIAVASSH